jgi:hypothetical protein
MQIVNRLQVVRITLLFVFFGLTLPLGIVFAQSQVSNKFKQTKIPALGGKTRTIPLIRRGENCSELAPQVLSLDARQTISTTNDYPTFLLFVPKTTAPEAEFILKDANREVIYSKSFSLSDNKSGIVRLTIPPNISSEKIVEGQTYRWEFNIICNLGDRQNNDESVVGKLQRVSISDASKSQSMQGSLKERLAGYRSFGFEYDALILLDEFRRKNPSDREIIGEWESSLIKYNLGELNQFPVVDKP